MLPFLEQYDITVSFWAGHPINRHHLLTSFLLVFMFLIIFAQVQYPELILYINNTLTHILFGGSLVLFIDSILYFAWNENFFQFVPFTVWTELFFH